tara:strand:- start:1028 stop:1717 length:690 start_codon:yes stop_codon:yes gene_type:complete
MKKGFDWGNSSENFINVVGGEILENSMYEKIYKVNKGDVVLDLGASVGVFSWTIMDRASKIIAVEPSKHCCSIIEKNVKGYPVHIENKGISQKNTIDSKMVYDNISNNHGWESIDNYQVEGISLKDIVKKHNLDRIDFIKTDCEGGEYSLFTDDNMDFLLNDVNAIVGEFHLQDNNLATEFRYFRDNYLKMFNEYMVFSVNGVDITNKLFDSDFIDYYSQIIIHMSNKE